jgi:putative phosphoribosyl transferase
MARFADRAAAGRELAQLVRERGVDDDAIVLALPRGGVPVAVEVAHGLQAPLDVMVVRKLSTPGHPELAFGAVSSGGVHWLGPGHHQIDPGQIEQIAAAQHREVAERERRYRPGREDLNIEGRLVVLVDDGIATGASLRAAVESARLRRARRVIVAAPVAPPDAVHGLERVADRVDVVEIRRGFGAVSVLYDDFSQVPEETVVALLKRSGWSASAEPDNSPDPEENPHNKDKWNV